MLDAAYGALKRVRQSNVVIGGNTFSGGDIRPVNWVQNKRLPDGRPPRLDLYGHNPFSLRVPDLRKPPSPEEVVDFSDLARFQKVIDRRLGAPRKRRIRLFLSEFTVPTGPDREFPFHVTLPTQVRFIDAAFRVAREIHAYGLGWIHLSDDPPRADGVKVSQGGLIDAGGNRKPGFEAFRGGRL